MPEADVDITVLMPTHSRSADLERTLTDMGRCDREGIKVEIVVVDNNSTDNTKEVIERLGKVLPLRYFFEKLPGKNHALNMALDQVPLGRIVLLTDDDVTPNINWFRAVLDASRRHPECQVFGGRQVLLWPDVPIPYWLRGDDVAWVSYGSLDYGDQEAPFADGTFPYGANYWVRREVFLSGTRFTVDVGGHRGCETEFLQRLRQSGQQMMYVPSSSITHRVQPELLTPRSIYRRADQQGRHFTGYFGPAMGPLLKRHPVIWYALAAGYVACAFVMRTIGQCIPTEWGLKLAVSNNHRLARVVSSIRGAGAYRRGQTCSVPG